MPRIPTYDDLQVAPRALNAPRQSSVASPSLFGASSQQAIETGRLMTNAGEAVNKVAAQMAERENADAIFRAETALKTDYLEFERAVRERRGADAKGVTDEASQWWDKQNSEFEKGFANDRQRALFRQQSERLRLQALDGLSRFESTERRRSVEEAAKASITSSINFAIGAVGSPDQGVALATAREDIIKRLDVLKQLNGWAPETYEAARMEALSNLHTQAIGRMVDNAPGAAREYFRANRDEIEGSQYERIEKSLQTGNRKVAAQAFADEVMANNLSEADAIRIARERFSGQDEVSVVAEIKTRFAELDVARSREQRQAADAAWDVYARTGSLNEIPVEVLDRLDGQTIMALRKEAQGGPAKTDWDKFYTLQGLATENPVGFANMDLRDQFPYLAETERRALIKMQNDIKAPDKLPEVATLTQQMSEAHNMLGYGSRDGEKKGLFDRAVRDAIDAEQRARGKPLTYEERQKIIDRMMTKGSINREWRLDPSGRVFELQNEPDFAANFMPEIAPADRAMIVERHKQRYGKEPTNAQINQIYRAWKGL